MFVSTSRLPIFGSLPLLLNAGLLLLLGSSGKVVQMKLESYGFLSDASEQEYTLEDAIDRLSKAILMKRFCSIDFGFREKIFSSRYDDAMFWAKQLNDSSEWNKFATALLYSLNIDYGELNFLSRNEHVARCY